MHAVACTTGEKIVDCAVREVREETGIVLADCGAEPDGARIAASITRRGTVSSIRCTWRLRQTRLTRAGSMPSRLVRPAALLAGQPRPLRGC